MGSEMCIRDSDYGADQLAGVVADEEKELVYTVERAGNKLYILGWNAQDGGFQGRLNDRNHYLSFNDLKQIREGGFRIYAAGRDPSNKFCDIHPSIGGFTIVDIALGFVEYFPKLALRKSHILPDLPEVNGNQPVFYIVLGFCRHAINLPSAGLDTICVSC